MERGNKQEWLLMSGKIDFKVKQTIKDKKKSYYLIVQKNPSGGHNNNKHKQQLLDLKG